MTEQYIKWHSPYLGRSFQMLVFGDRGMPVVLFPTSMGSYVEHKHRGMVDAAHWFVRQGLVKIYCPDSIDAESWYDSGVAPSVRVYNHTRYDALILKEVVVRAQEETGYERVVMAGCSFGGYHAANFAFRHPELVSYMFSMSGLFDISFRMDGYYDDHVYYNNPVDFMVGNEDPKLWEMGIVLGVAETDICRSDNERFSGLLSSKGIPHWLDIMPGTTHDWPTWLEMFPRYLGQITW